MDFQRGSRLSMRRGIYLSEDGESGVNGYET
jgi:hypothetical protein